MDNSHHCYGTGRSRQTPDDVLSESQMMSRFFLDHEERVISLVSADAFQIYKQSGGIDWLIHGADWRRSFLLLPRFHCGERGRVFDVVSSIVGVTTVFMADTMLEAAVVIAMRIALKTSTTDFHLPLSSHLLILHFRGEASAVFADVADPPDWAHTGVPSSRWRSPT